MSEPTHDDWVRLAAFLDGEGYITIARRNNSGGRFAKHYLRVSLTNTDPRMIQWAKDTFGGACYVQERNNPKHKTAFTWVTLAAKAEQILVGCLPFFLIKREQAETGLAFRKMVTVHHSRGCRGLTEAEVMEREKLYRNMRDLKQVSYPKEAVQ